MLAPSNRHLPPGTSSQRVRDSDESSGFFGFYAMEREVKGIFIPIGIWEASDLSWNEKILLMEIDSFTSKGKDCYFSNEYISEFLGVTDRMARKLLSGLIDKGYVRKTKFDGRRRFIETTIAINVGGRVAQKFRAERKHNSGQGGNSVPHTYTKDLNTNTDLNPLSKERPLVMKRPSLEEVRAYCIERGNNIDPQAFIDFYESNGWKVGKNPMKDWRAAVRTWEQRDRQNPSPRSGRPSPQQEDYVQKGLRMLQKLHETGSLL